jgi:hypothetical protein
MVKDEPSLIISDYYDFHGKSSFFCNSHILCGSLEGDPLSPQRGKQHAGMLPLTPSFFGVFSTLSGVIAIGGMPERRGRKHEMMEPPRAIVCFYEGFNKADFCNYYADRCKGHY